MSTETQNHVVRAWTKTDFDTLRHFYVDLRRFGFKRFATAHRPRVKLYHTLLRQYESVIRTMTEVNGETGNSTISHDDETP